MVSLALKTDTEGFWFLIEAPEECAFSLEYIAIGTSNRQSFGEIKSICCNRSEWQYQRLGFPVLRVGVTDFQLAAKGIYKNGEIGSPEIRRTNSLRIPSIEHAGSMCLAGGVLNNSYLDATATDAKAEGFFMPYSSV